MKNARVMGIGAISALGNSAGEIWERLDTEQAGYQGTGKLEYTSCLPSAKRRRLNRYSDMALYSAHSAVQDAACDLEGLPPERIGTIYTTGYGPMVSNLEFAAQVSSGDPDLCSPTLFAGTVANTCLGHICMNLNCKGVSTILMGSDSLGYSQMLLSRNAADYILSGAVDEYSEDLFHSLRCGKQTGNVPFCESAVTLLLAGEEAPAESAYCTLTDFGECDIGGCPLFQQVDEEAAAAGIRALLRQVTEGKPVDLVLSGGSGLPFDRAEREAIRAVLPDVPCIGSVKTLFGETLGAAFHIGVMTAALILKHGRLPAALAAEAGGVGEIHRVLVTGCQVSGGYTAYVVEK